MEKDKRSIFKNVLFIFNNKFIYENFFSQQTEQDQFYSVGKLLNNYPLFAVVFVLFENVRLNFHKKTMYKKIFHNKPI